MRVRSSTAAVLVLALAVLTVLPAHAAPKAPVRMEHAGLLSQWMGFLGKLPGRIVAVWGKAGSAIDPFGTPEPRPVEEDTPDDDSGSGVDPWGKT